MEFLIKIMRVVGIGLSIGSLVAAIVGWKVAWIYEEKLDSIHKAAEANGGMILLVLDNAK